jgi:P-type Mg2+ transporter
MWSSNPTRVAIVGLTTQDAKGRLDRFGPNGRSVAKHHSAVYDFLRGLANPLALILVIAAAASAFLGQKVDAIIISVIVLLSAAVDFAQTYRSRGAVEKLSAEVAPTATVMRDGEWKEIKRREVVPGDIVLLSAGDPVPAGPATSTKVGQKLAVATR